MPSIYVTEPAVIDLDLVKTILKNTAYHVVAGNIEFKDSDQEPFEALLIRSATNVGSDIKKYFPQLKAVIRVGTGLDNVDLAYCKAEGIEVFNAPGANAYAVSEYVVGVILYVTRKLHLLTTQDATSWNRFKFTGHSMEEQTIGIVGYGHIGRLLHEKLSGFACKEFLIYDPYLPPSTELKENTRLVPLDELLSQSSIVSLHLPLTDETKYLINAKTLKLLQPGSLLINSARGGIVDEAALLATIDKQDLTYVADTVEGEPHVNPKLLNHQNIIVTPHIASLTSSSEREMVQLSLTNFLQHKPLPNSN